MLKYTFGKVLGFLSLKFLYSDKVEEISLDRGLHDMHYRQLSISCCFANSVHKVKTNEKGFAVAETIVHIPCVLYSKELIAAAILSDPLGTPCRVFS